MKKLLLVFLLAPAFSQAQAVPTATAVLTATFTATVTKTLSNTPTATITRSPTMTLTPTISPTPTVTATGTLPTKTFTPTITMTATLTATGTLPTSTSTATKTLTSTVTMTPTYTSTPGVFEFKVSSEPEVDGKIKFHWGTTIKAQEVDVKIFTTGFRLVRQFNFDRHEHGENLNPGVHEFSWDGRDEEDRPMPPGHYLCFILVETEKKTYEASGKTNIH